MIEAPFTSLGRCIEIEQIVHLGLGWVEVDLHLPHHEGEARRFLLGFLEQRAVIGPEQPQVIGAAALHETQIAGVIDDAGKIGVLVIDPDLLVMQAVGDGAVDGMLRSMCEKKNLVDVLSAGPSKSTK